MAYNYSAYGATYGQQYAAAQPSTYSSQQTGTTTAGYGQYGQTSPYGSSISTSSTSAAASTSSTYGYGAGINTTSSNQPRTGTNNYSYSSQQGYGYRYADAGSAYGNGSAQNSVLQSFQQAWYGASTSNMPNTSQQSPAGTTQQQNVQTQQYGNALQSQYLQQYQQMMYQQYASSTATTPQQQQGMFKSPQPVGTKPRTGMQSGTNAQAKPDQSTPGWGGYNQRQEIGPSSTRQNDSSNSTGWNSTQLQHQVQGGLPVQQQQQQQKSPVVKRSPMKYNQNDLPYSAMNQGYKNSNVNVGQGYSNSSQLYSMPGQGFNTTSNSLTNQAYSSPNQGYNVGMYKSSTVGNYNNSGFNSTGFGNMQAFGPNQTYGNQNYNKGYMAPSNSSNNQQNQTRPSTSVGPKIPQHGGMGSQMNEVSYQPFQSPIQQPRPLMQGMMMSGRGRGGSVRPPIGRGSPVAGNMGYPGPGPARAGAPDGPDIPPFPQAWHSQDYDGPGPGDWQRGSGGFGDVTNRWARNGQRGRYLPQPMQPKGIYNNNSRNARGGPSTNRELWSPAEKSKSSVASSSSSDRDTKWSARSKDDGDSSDKNKNTEIKSFLYAWLGPRNERPNYDMKQVGEKPNISFQCELRVEKYPFFGFGEASSKKEAQTAAAWDFANHLVKKGELAESDLPEKSEKYEDSEKDFTSMGENEGNNVVENGEKKKEDERDTKSCEKVDNKRRDVGGNQKRNRERERWSQHYSRGANSAVHCGRMGGMARGRPPAMDIPPLMAQPVGPWEGSPMGPPHMMPHPPMMDYGGWGPIPPNMPMGPPPPLMRRNYQNDYWRRRDMQERMRDDIGMRWNQEWQHPEDIFIHQMIMNQQEAEKVHHKHRSHEMPPMEAAPGEWHSVATARPIVTSDDRHVMAKHDEIYPQEGKLNNLYRIVNTVEQALKLLSDKFVDEDHPRLEENKEDKEKDVPDSTVVNNSDEKVKEDESPESKTKEQQTTVDGEEDVFEAEKSAEDKEKDAVNDGKINTEQEKGVKKDEKRAKIKILKRPKKAQKQVDTRPRVLCGVNRIGPLAKGLLISRDDHVDLALLCGEIPTVKLLDRIMEHIGEKLSEVDKDFKLVVEKREDEAGFLVTSVDNNSPVEAMVTLTKSGLRKAPKKVEESNAVMDNDKKQEQSNENSEEKKEPLETTVEDMKVPVGMLSRQKMIDALACLRHTNWFQAKACSLQSCVILTRILRDLQRRDRVWLPLKEWALEVLIYNCLASSEEQMSAGDACRRFFEVVAGGTLLPGRPGLQDPCERALRDVLDCCTVQEKEEITKSAQRFLRHLAFREIHKILGMEKLVPTYKSNAMDSRQNTRSSPDAEDKSSDANNLRKRRFEHNGADSQAESPKRSLTDEEDTDTQQNLAELSISDEASEGRSALDEAESEPSMKEKMQDDNSTASVDAEVDEVTQPENTVLETAIEDGDKPMETVSAEGVEKINKEEDVPHQNIMDT